MPAAGTTVRSEESCVYQFICPALHCELQNLSTVRPARAIPASGTPSKCCRFRWAWDTRLKRCVLIRIHSLGTFGKVVVDTGVVKADWEGLQVRLSMH